MTMGHLLKRKYVLVSDWKLTSKKIWQKQHASSRNPLLYYASQQHSLFSASRLSNTTYDVHCHQRQLTHFGAVYFSKITCEKPVSQRSKNIHFPHFSTSFLESDIGLVTSNGLNVQTECFLEKLQMCVSVDEVLTLAEVAVRTETLRVDSLSQLFSAFKDQVYETFTSPWFYPDLQVKRKQIHWNNLTNQLIKPFTSDSRFQNLFSYSETLVGEMTSADCVNILGSLHYLRLSADTSTFMHKILQKCSEHLHTFDLNQLAVLSSCHYSFHSDIVFQGAIVNAAKIWLTMHTAQDLDIDCLCKILINLSYITTDDMKRLSTEMVIDKLKMDPTSVPIDTINQVSFLVPHSQHGQKLLDCIFDLPSECFTIDRVNNFNLNFCSKFASYAWMYPMLNKVRAHFASEFIKADSLSIQDMVKYCLVLNTQPNLVMENKGKMFVQYLEESDNFILYQLMRHHSHADIGKLPGSQELLHAYLRRLDKLFTAHNELETLLWGQEKLFSRLVYNFILKCRSSGLKLSPALARALDINCMLQPSDWSTAFKRIAVASTLAVDKLKSDVALRSEESSLLINCFHHLNMDGIIELCVKLDMTLTVPNLSPSVRAQIFKLKTKLQEMFEFRLSCTNKLDFSFPRKIMRQSRKHKQFKFPGSGMYSHLMENLPRFLKDRDRDNCVVALNLLHTSIEVFPIHEKETFEILTSFVTTSPELLVTLGMKLVKVLAFAGYQPELYDDWTAWTQQLIDKVMDSSSLDGAMQVQFAYHLSLLGIFHGAFLARIFSLPFLTVLEQECGELSERKAEKVKQILALLNQSVTIEFPHLQVPWFCGSLLSANNVSESSRTVNKVIESICRLTGSGGYVVKSAKSPYEHHIDGLMYFDPSSGLIECSQVGSNPPVSNVERIALLCPQESNFCYRSQVLTGKYQADIRQLQMLGYHVVLFTERELSTMDTQVQEGLDSYVRAKINNGTHFQVFPES